MKIDSVDLFYLRMPEVLDIGDGSQDMLLVRVEADGNVGWGDCEASPLTSIASFVTPLSHSACHPVAASVLGERVNGVEDIARISAKVRARSYDLLQSYHMLAGIEIALWDLVGRVQERPIWEMLGYSHTLPKTPYASVLFGDDPQQTLDKGAELRAQGFTAVKFGWGPYGLGTTDFDADLVAAAREGVGPDTLLLVDAGTVFGEDVDAAAERLPALEAARVGWLEEPFHAGALRSYRGLSERSTSVRLAGGEGSHHPLMAEQLIDYGGVGFIQIDVGRVGGIADATRVAKYAEASGVTFVNHSFTSHLALSASMQPYAGLSAHEISEFPGQLTSLAQEATTQLIELDQNGKISAPDAPGLGLDVDVDRLQKYLVDVQIAVDGSVLYETPTLR